MFNMLNILLFSQDSKIDLLDSAEAVKRKLKKVKGLSSVSTSTSSFRMRISTHLICY